MKKNKYLAIILSLIMLIGVIPVSSAASVKRMKDSNKVTLTSRAAAIGAGYTPCKNCNS